MVRRMLTLNTLDGLTRDRSVFDRRTYKFERGLDGLRDEADKNHSGTRTQEVIDNVRLGQKGKTLSRKG